MPKRKQRPRPNNIRAGVKLLSKGTKETAKGVSRTAKIISKTGNSGFRNLKVEKFL